MKKLYLFLLACLMTCVANAAKVYFQADTWTEVNAYAWSQAGNVSASWPGTPMTLNEDTGLWEVEFSSTPENIIFNNGSSQTDDLKFKDGATYKQDGSIVGEVEELITLTATFDNSLSNWDNVNIYYWEGASVAWPGAAMTKGSDNTYTFTAQVRNLPNKVMFNNGSDAGKTADLAFVNNSVYDMNGLKGDDPTPPTPPTPAVEDLYLVGDNFGGWALDETYKFTKNENVYTLTIPEGLSGEWKIWNGTWDYTFGAGASQPEAGTEAEVWFLSAANFTTETTTETTLTFTLVEGSDVKDSSIPSTLLIEAEEGDDPTPPTPAVEDLYLVGDNFGGWALDETYKFTKNENVYTLTIPEGLSGEWKIWNGTWDYTFGAGASQPEAGTEAEVWFLSAANFTTETTTETTLTFTLVEGSDVKDSSIPSTLLIEAEEGDDPTPPTPAVEDLYLVGDNFGGWALDETYKFTKNENVYTLTIPEGLSGEWKIWNGTWDYTFGAGASQPEAGTEAEVWFLSAANFTTETTTETTLTFTLVEGSDVKDSSIPSTLLIEAENGDDPTPPTPVETPEHLYIVGNVNGTSWDVTAPMELTKSGNTFTASDVALIDAGNGYSYFTFITVTGADWDIVNGGDRFGAPAQDTPVVASEPMEMVKYAEGVNASAAQSWMIDSSMEAIDIVVDFENMTMTATRSAGIDAIGNGSTKISVIGGILSVEGAGNVNVFTTDGAHISSSAKTALAPGLYIIVADGKASKVMVK